MAKARKYNEENLPNIIAEISNGTEVYLTHAYMKVPNKSKPSGFEVKLFVVTFDHTTCTFRKPTTMSDFVKYHKKRKVGTGKPKWNDQKLHKAIAEITNGEMLYINGSFHTDANSQQVVEIFDKNTKKFKVTTLSAIRKKYK